MRSSCAAACRALLHVVPPPCCSVVRCGVLHTALHRALEQRGQGIAPPADVVEAHARVDNAVSVALGKGELMLVLYW